MTYPHPWRGKKNPPIRDFPYWILKELLLKNNKEKEREKERKKHLNNYCREGTNSLSEFSHAYRHMVWISARKKKSRFQVFIAEVASVNKVFIGKSDWTAMALKAISESTEQCKSLRSRWTNIQSSLIKQFFQHWAEVKQLQLCNLSFTFLTPRTRNLSSI